MDLDVVTKEDLAEWREYKVTKAYIAAIQELVKEHFKALGNGGTLNLENAEATALETAKTVGSIQALQDILDIQAEDI